MNHQKPVPFVELLSTIEEYSEGWVYLPTNKPWTLESDAAILKSEEVPPELEDDPEAGIPAFAKQNDLMQALPVGTVQDIVKNAKTQRREPPAELLLKAFLFYYDHDAFIIFP
jgi:hypothetical protein